MANQTDFRFGPWYDVYTGWPILTLEAEGAITKGNLLQLGTAGRQVIAYDGDNAVTAPAIGVALSDAANGEQVPVVGLGPVMLMKVGTSLATRGQWAVPSTTAAESGRIQGDDGQTGTTENACIGIVLETADVLGELVPIMVCGRGAFGAN